jgi:hypothetical protein
MARIRTIKPEFPHSESMGRVSRDARLLFVELWCICDDHGRTRAASRMLASLLFPYDDDAPRLIDGWLAELEREGCIVVYERDGSRYLEVRNWLKHQKIDKPSRPMFPAFGESSRILANPREHSALDLDLDLRTKDHGSKEPAPGQPQPPTEPLKLTPPDDDQEPEAPDSTAARSRRSPIELQTWLNSLAADEDPIHADDPIMAYADDAGIEFDWLLLAWDRFRQDMIERRTKKRDWRAHFRNAVRNNWYRLWWARDGDTGLTTVGEQAMMVWRNQK